MKNLFKLLIFIFGLAITFYANSKEMTVTQSNLRLVQKIYKDFPPTSTAKSISSQKSSVLSRYFDTNLTNLIVNDNLCAQKTKEICNLDFDPIYNSQDVGYVNIKLVPIGTSNVVVTLKGQGITTVLKYVLIKTPKGVKVSDIIYDNNLSLTQILK